MSRFPAARFLFSAASPTQFPPDQGVEVAFAGRSNAGKSSAINALTSRNSLARTSKTPGRTRLLNFFELAEERRIVDLPGYGYARVHEEERKLWAPLLEGLRQRECFSGLFLIVDSRRGVSEADEYLIEWADPGVRQVHVLLSKADQLNQSDAAKVLKATTAKLQGRATVQLLSMLKKTGIENAQNVLAAWFDLQPPTK